MSTHLLIKRLVEKEGFELENVPIVSEYYHNRALGSSRSISLILSDLHDLGVIAYNGAASGGSEGDHQLHLWKWTAAYITKEGDVSDLEMLEKLAIRQPNTDCQFCKNLSDQKVKLFNEIVKLQSQLDSYEKVVKEKNFIISEMGQHIKNLKDKTPGAGEKGG